MKGSLIAAIILGVAFLVGIGILISPISRHEYWSGRGVLSEERYCELQNIVVTQGSLLDLRCIEEVKLCDGDYYIVLNDLPWHSNTAPFLDEGGDLRQDYHKERDDIIIAETLLIVFGSVLFMPFFIHCYLFTKERRG
jgi:hypothetical protein